MGGELAQKGGGSWHNRRGGGGPVIRHLYIYIYIYFFFAKIIFLKNWFCSFLMHIIRNKSDINMRQLKKDSKTLGGTI